MNGHVNAVAASRIALGARFAGGALLLGSAPAAAEQARAVMSVTAIVAPACSVALDPTGRPQPAIACSTGASVSTMTARRHNAQPLVEAEALLGTPVRRGGAVVFTASAAPRAPAEAGSHGAGGSTRYLTITY